MISAKKAKEQIIKSISKKKYIEKVKALIYCDIDEYDDVYMDTTVSKDSKKCIIEISWKCLTSSTGCLK